MILETLQIVWDSNKVVHKTSPVLFTECNHVRVFLGLLSRHTNSQGMDTVYVNKV